MCLWSESTLHYFMNFLSSRSSRKLIISNSFLLNCIKDEWKKTICNAFYWLFKFISCAAWSPRKSEEHKPKYWASSQPADRHDWVDHRRISSSRWNSFCKRKFSGSNAGNDHLQFKIAAIKSNKPDRYFFNKLSALLLSIFWVCFLKTWTTTKNLLTTIWYHLGFQLIILQFPKKWL